MNKIKIFIRLIFLSICLSISSQDYDILIQNGHIIDVKNNIDIVEEIIRIYGYDNINVSIPSSSRDEINNIENSLVNKKFKTISKLKKTLVSNGISEVITFSFHSNRAQEILTGDTSLKIWNASDKSSVSA